MDNPSVLILMGSDSDYPVLEGAGKFFEKMGVSYEMRVSSAHRTPDRTHALVKEAEEAGVKVFICAAGMAAHLGGVVASLTTKPVIGIPVDASPLGGMDALLSTVQMPPGVPVATVAVGKAGATNAAVLACQILALSDGALAKKMTEERNDMAASVVEKDKRLEKRRSSQS
ncbi:MAG: 5-(carboxyamino)imidazole ribonucleotide mutase [Deltaproteobacteria bacterium]|nr:MAG: 5-(carboxyamino)imidazole ribonucleotide mutase [Deltaproteobacteria bacterium]